MVSENAKMRRQSAAYTWSEIRARDNRTVAKAMSRKKATTESKKLIVRGLFFMILHRTHVAS